MTLKFSAGMAYVCGARQSLGHWLVTESVSFALGAVSRHTAKTDKMLPCTCTSASSPREVSGLIGGKLRNGARVRVWDKRRVAQRENLWQQMDMWV